MSLTPNLVHISLAHLDPRMLTSPDGKRVEVNLEAIAHVVNRESEKAMKHGERRGVIQAVTAWIRTMDDATRDAIRSKLDA